MPQSQQDRNQNYRDGQRAIPRRKPAHPARRARLEKNAAKWLKHYFPRAFKLPFGQVHQDIIDTSVYAIEEGKRGGVIAPRGSGKSTVINGVCLYSMATGRARFPAVIPWSAKDYKKALQFWKNALCFNKEFIDDYPEICDPFARGRGVSAKVKTLMWADTKQPTGAQICLSEGMIVLPDSKGVIGSSTLNGNPRGLYHSTEDGDVLRPDLVLIDDPSDKATAKSETQTQNNIDMINEDVLGMGGPDNYIAAIMTATIITNTDTASHYCNNPEWHFVKVGQITTWPENKELWDDWNEIRLAGDKEKDGGKSALKFYNDHYEELTKGFTVYWKDRYDKKRGDPDAKYSAMKDYYVMGRKAFMSERQNEPLEQVITIYDISPEIVMQSINGKELCEIDKTCTQIIAFADINYSALHWSVVAFRPDFSGDIIAYGRTPHNGVLIPKNSTEAIIRQRILQGLEQWLKTLIDLKIPVSKVGIDSGKWGDTVRAWIESKRNGLFFSSRGFASIRYNPNRNALQLYDNAHLSEGPVVGRYIAFNADYWRETAQRAFLCQAGEPGAITIYGDKADIHQEYAMQICGEKLVDKGIGATGTEFYKWAHLPGSNWDWLDSLVGCYVGAAVCGLNSTGLKVLPDPVQRETRKPKIQRAD